MSRPKSILKGIEVDVAQRSHNCQHNKNHRIHQGDKRLNIRKGRSWERYCVNCALKTLKCDIEKLQEVVSKLQSSEK